MPLLWIEQLSDSLRANNWNFLIKKRDIEKNSRWTTDRCLMDATLANSILFCKVNRVSHIYDLKEDVIFTQNVQHSIQLVNLTERWINKALKNGNSFILKLQKSTKYYERSNVSNEPKSEPICVKITFIFC